MSSGPIPRVGSTFGAYRIDAVLGRGGMGVVYRAEDLRLGRNVALKLLPPELSEDQQFRERFLRESRLAASIEHTGVVPIYEAGEVGERLYIAMRYIEGRDLGAVVRQDGPMEPARAVTLVAQLADALQAAHAKGLIHRDVKPSNALVSADDAGEHIFLTDFGITEDVSTPRKLADSGVLAGTAGYMAPERIRGDSADARSDVYSLGCVLFECLTGQAPFARHQEVATIYAHLEEDPPRASVRRPGISAGLDLVVARALEKDPDDRWQTAAAMADAARAAVAPEPVAAAGARRPRAALLAAGVAAALVVVVAVVAALSSSGGDRLTAIDENHVGLIDAGSGDITAQYPVGRDPSAVTVGGGSIWVANAGDETVSRIDKGRPIVTIPVGRDPTAMAFAAGSLWITAREDRTLVPLNVAANRVGRKIPLSDAPRALAAGFGALWVAYEIDRKVARFDLTRGGFTAPIELAANPTALAVGAGSLWVASEEAGTVFRIDPRTRAVAKAIAVGNGPIGIAVGERGIWVANRQDGTVSRIDPATNRVVRTVTVGEDPSAVAAGAGSVWVANSGDGTVSRIDPARSRVAETIRVVGNPTALAIDGRSVLVTALASNASHRGGTLRVEMHGPTFFVHDLGPTGPIDSQNLQSLVYDGLVAYPRAGGSTFGTLVGNLARDVPEPSPDGRTYVFKLRPGIRYSDGRLVAPEDFRASLAELLKRHGRDIPAYYSKIRGAIGCVRRPARCDLSAGIATDAASRTITLRLTEPDPDLLDKLAFTFANVAPAARPFRAKAPPPGTGPYRIVSVDFKRGVRLVRNPHFRVWSRDARPDGFPDVIEVRFGNRIDAQVAAVQRDRGDVVTVGRVFGGPLSPARIRAVGAQSAPQLHTDAVPETDYMWLNARVAPFDNVHVRRALDLATDRRRVAMLAGGSDLAQPTCQLLPPGFPGYRPTCPHGPDLQRARRLVARSGTQGMRITVWTYEIKRSIGRYFASLLHRLGYRTRLRVFPDYPAYGEEAADSRTRAQIGINGWSADVETPSNFTVPFLCSSFVPADPGATANLSEFCDEGIDDRVDAAQRARRARRDAVWRSIFERIAAAAPAVPLVNRREMVLVSRRVGNYQHHPLWGPLYDQMWVR
jgi:YVTN family beta-propeller protein